MYKTVTWNTGSAATRFRLKNKKKKRIKHNDLTHYFIRDHKDLPPAYLRSCEKFFKRIKKTPVAPYKNFFWPTIPQRQASSSKRQASSTKQQAPAGLNLNTIKIYK
jgi:hypothetical protein